MIWCFLDNLTLEYVATESIQLGEYVTESSRSYSIFVIRFPWNAKKRCNWPNCWILEWQIAQRYDFLNQMLKRWHWQREIIELILCARLIEKFLRLQVKLPERITIDDDPIHQKVY